MILNCQDLSFYTKNRNFIILKKLPIFFKNIAFSPKSAETYRFQIWLFVFYKSINEFVKLAMKQ